MKLQLDHLVVAARYLQQGVDYIEEKLGVIMPFGGEHPKMGTHNHLMQLGGGVFLEIIAINPDAPAPQRPRWFGLDDPLVQKSLDKSPRLLTWVANCNDISEVIKNAACSFGQPELISRGELNWHFALPADGRVLGGGFLPYLIQWHVDEHPSKKMADFDVRLQSLEIYHPYPGWLETILASINVTNLVKVSGISPEKKPYIKAVFTTPRGRGELSG